MKSDQYPTARLQRDAVQYLRMSTEHQRYSLESQATTIAQYAARQGYNIVGTYADSGKSGITLKGREALSRLLNDVDKIDRQFSTILVLDVSRWGRFQDPDQSASYEFLCREAGVEVQYCGEMFENDGSLTTAIIKHIKRIMAAEFSRELSAKVSIAHLRQAALGYYQGAGYMYGARRMLIDENGNPRTILESGQRKFLITDKVILISGPEFERKVIRRIFRLFVKCGLSQSTIAERLNQDGIPSVNGAPWTVGRVHGLLTSEISLGIYTYNKVSQKLKTPARKNPEELWIRQKIMEPIISKNIFLKAQEKLKAGKGRLKRDRDMIKVLRKLLRERGTLSEKLINECLYTPNAGTYVRHFGSLGRSYELVGFKPSRPRFRLPYRPSERHSDSISDEFLINTLKRLQKTHGYLSVALIDNTPEIRPARGFIRRFGSMRAAYAKAGFDLTLAQIRWMGQCKKMPITEGNIWSQ